MEGETHTWTYIPVSDFKVPPPPASDAARGAALRLWKAIQSIFSQPDGKQSAVEKHQWDRPPVDLLRSISPDLDWTRAAIQLADEIGGDWFENQQPDRLIYSFVGAPGVNIAETLQRLAQDRQLSVLSAPSTKSLLEASSSDIPGLNAELESSSEIVVVPQLERWYLRRENGFTLVRNLLERLSLQPRRVLFGCDSWAWAFLQQAVGIEDMLGEPLTLAPFDSKRLDSWLRSTIDFQNHEFRQRGSDEVVFPEMPNGDDRDVARSTLIGSLAAKARGNPGVALAHWQACLRTRDADGDAATAPNSAGKSMIWVVAPTNLALLELPVDVDRLHRFVLHSILLHGGLSPSSLETVLPFSSGDIRRRVSALRRADVLHEDGGTLQVTLTAYPLVRRKLQSEGLLTDAF